MAENHREFPSDEEESQADAGEIGVECGDSAEDSAGEERELTIFSNPRHVRSDLKLAKSIARRQKLRSEVIEAGYSAIQAAFKNEKLSPEAKMRSLPGLAALVKADAEVEKFESGQIDTVIQVNQQINQQTQATVTTVEQKREPTVAEEIAAMGASMLPPSLLYAKLGLQLPAVEIASAPVVADSATANPTTPAASVVAPATNGNGVNGSNGASHNNHAGNGNGTAKKAAALKTNGKTKNNGSTNGNGHGKITFDDI